MESIEYRTGISPGGEENGSTQIRHLARFASHWDKFIRRELHRFAQYRWPDTRLLGLIPIHHYRLRKQLKSRTMVWWIERDIPPYDRHLCAAYRVELSLVDAEQPQLLVHSGSSMHAIVPMNLKELQTALARVSNEKPLVIRRRFEPAIDP